MNRIKHWIKLKLYDLLEISNIRTRINENRIEIINLKEIIKERTEYHLDVHQRAATDSQVILIGKYKKMDFVKCYNIDDRSFDDLILHCRDLEKYARHNKIDAWPRLSAVIKHELNFF